MKTLDEVTERVKERVRGCQWVHEDLRVWARRFGPAPEEDKEDTREAYVRGLCRRKAQWPERADADAAVVFLSSKACLPYLALCRDQTLEGSDWEPVWAWFEQEDQTTQNPRAGWIHQILRRKDAEAGVDGPYVLEDGCKRKVTATFYWDVADVPACPESASGVQYEVNVRGRDDETGLYNCVVTRTETVRQDVPAYETHEETGETRYRADALGLREEEAKSDKNPNAGGTVDQKIEDYAKAQGLELEDGPKELKDGTTVGVVVDLQKQKNADCTTDVTIQNIHEEESDSHVVETRETLRGTQTATTHLHITETKAKEYEAGYGDGKLTTTRVEKTPGGVRNVTVTETDSTPVAAGNGNAVCARTIFEHTHTELAENQDGATREARTVSKGDGVYEQVQVVANDDGTFNEEVRTTTELEVQGAKLSYGKTAFETVEANTDQNTKSAPDSTFAEPDKATGNVMTQTEGTMTPGGVWQTTTTKTTPKAWSYEATFAADQKDNIKRMLWFKNQTKAWVDAEVKRYTDGSVSVNPFGLYDGTLYIVWRDDDGKPGSGWLPEYEKERVERTYKDQFDIAEKVIRRTIYTYTVVEGVLNDNAAAAYAKCADSKGPSSVSFCGKAGDPTTQGFYRYMYVKSITTTFEDIPYQSGTTV